MRRVDHLAVEAERAGAGIGGEQVDDAARVRDLLVCRREGLVDHRHLRGVDRHHTGEAVARAAGGISGKTVEIAEIGVDRLDRRDARGMCAEQGERASELVGGGVAAVGLARGGGADRGGQILRAPGQAGKARGHIAVAAEREDRGRGFGGDRQDRDVARQPGVERAERLSPFRLGQDDTVGPRGQHRGE